MSFTKGKIRQVPPPAASRLALTKMDKVDTCHPSPFFSRHGIDLGYLNLLKSVISPRMDGDGIREN